ncbi:MAG: EamA family transporter, partial [Chitinophagaceae bacterium]|nr:EamA family transporter [Chitinophagaceae bacterium]
MRKAFYQLHGAVLLAGFTGILGRLITLNELMIVFYRLLITALTMFLLFSWKKAIEKTTSKLKLQILLAAIFAASHWLTFYGAIKYAN